MQTFGRWPKRSYTRSCRTLRGKQTVSHPALTRRELLSASASIGSTLVVGGAASDAKTIAGEMPWAPGVASAPLPAAPGPNRFFNSEEARFIDAAVARLIP